MSLSYQQPYQSPQTGIRRFAKMPSRGVQLALGLGFGMAAIIAGTVFVGPGVAFLSIPFLMIAVAFFALYKPAVSLSCYLTYCALEGMYKYLSGFSQLIYIIKPVLALVLLLAWLFSLRALQKRPHLPPFVGLLAMFAAWGGIELFFPTGAGILESALTLIIWYLLPIGFYFYAFNVFKTQQRLELVLIVFMVICTVVSAFAIVQYGMGKEWTLAHLPGYELITEHNWWVTDESGKIENSSWSPASTTSYSGIAATWSNIGAVLGVGLLLLPGNSRDRKILFFACLLTNIMALLVSGTRLWVILFPVETLVIVFFTGLSKKDLIQKVGGMAAFLVIIGIGFFVAQSLTGGMAAKRYAGTAANPLAKFQHDRGENMTYLPYFIMESPLGIGFQRGADFGTQTGGASKAIMTNRETQFNCIAADMGLPGLILLCLIVIGLLARGWISFRMLTDPHLKIIGVTLFALLLGNAIAFFGGPVLQGADYFWLLAGSLLGLPYIEKRQPETTALVVSDLL